MELIAKKGDQLLALEDFDGLTEDELSFKQVLISALVVLVLTPPG